MPNIAFLCNDILSHVTASHISHPNLPLLNALEHIVEFDPTAKNVAYIGSSKQIAEALESVGDTLECTTFFACDDQVNLMDIARERHLNVIVVDLDPFVTHSRIARAIRTYRDWRIALLETGNETQSIHKVLQSASDISGSSLFLLNKANQVVYSAVNEADRTDKIATELLETGRLSEETSALMVAAEEANTKPIGTQLKDNGTFGFFRHSVVRDGEPFYSIILIRQRLHPIFDGSTFVSMIATVIDSMTNSDGDHYWAGEDFKSFVEKLSMSPDMSEEEIRQHLMTLPVVPDKYCSFIVIDFDSPEAMPDPVAYFISQVEAIFPNCNACAYNGAIVLLYGRPDRFHWRKGHTFDFDKFNELLTQYHACASISTATSKLDALRNEYMLTRRILTLGRKLRYRPEERIFFGDDYAEYMTLDLCYPQFLGIMGNDDLIALTHPDPVNLWRYDKVNNDNLLDVLYYYCLCGPNVAKTAERVYMHRNTVAAKLKKIEKIVVDDITDGEVQQRIILSYRIMRYLDLCTTMPLALRIGLDKAPQLND